jgi:hypothetical protein
MAKSDTTIATPVLAIFLVLLMSLSGCTGLTDESEEIDAIFKVPISFLLKDDRFRNDPINRNGKVYYVPAYKYQSYVIWGLTAMITVDFLNLACDAGIDLSNPTIIKEKK